MADFLENLIGVSLDSIKPVVSAGFGLYDAYNSGQHRDDIASIVQQREQEKYDNAMANREAYLNHLANYGQGGGGGAGGDGGHGAAEAGRIRAGQKGLKVMKNQMKRGRKFLKPYRQAGKEVLPHHTAASIAGLQGLTNLASFFQTPEQQAKFNQTKPALQMGADSKIGSMLPNHMLRSGY